MEEEEEEVVVVEEDEEEEMKEGEELELRGGWELEGRMGGGVEQVVVGARGAGGELCKFAIDLQRVDNEVKKDNTQAK